MCAEFQQQQQTEAQLLLQLWYAGQQQRDPLLLTTLQHFSPSPASIKGIPFCQLLSLCTTLLWKRDSLLLFTVASKGIPTYSLLCLCSRALQLPRDGFPTACHIPLQHSTLVCSRGIPFYFCSKALRLSRQRDSTQQPLPHLTPVREISPLQQSSSATSREIPFLYLPLQQCTPATINGFLSGSHIPLQHSVQESSRRSPFYYFSVQYSGFQRRDSLLVDTSHQFGYLQRDSLLLLLATSAAQHAGYQQRDSLLLSMFQCTDYAWLPAEELTSTTQLSPHHCSQATSTYVTFDYLPRYLCSTALRPQADTVQSSHYSSGT